MSVSYSMCVSRSPHQGASAPLGSSLQTSSSSENVSTHKSLGVGMSAVQFWPYLKGWMQAAVPSGTCGHREEKRLDHSGAWLHPPHTFLSKSLGVRTEL